jgi:hypothetical protein
MAARRGDPGAFAQRLEPALLGHDHVEPVVGEHDRVERTVPERHGHGVRLQQGDRSRHDVRGVVDLVEGAATRSAPMTRTPRAASGRVTRPLPHPRSRTPIPGRRNRWKMRSSPLNGGNSTCR